MAEGYEPRPLSPTGIIESIGFSTQNFSNSTTTVTPGGSWYSLNCAVTGKKLIGIAGFGVDYPNSMSISNITIGNSGTVSMYIVNSSSGNLSGYNFTGLYINS